MRRLILAIVAVLAPVAANAQHNWYVERDDNTGCEKPQAFQATPQNVVSNLLAMGITTDPIVKHLADGSVVVGIQVPVSVQFPNGGGFYLLLIRGGLRAVPCPEPRDGCCAQSVRYELMER